MQYIVLIGNDDMKRQARTPVLIVENLLDGGQSGVCSVNRSIASVSMKGQIVATGRAVGLLINMATSRCFFPVRNERDGVTVLSTLLFGSALMARLCQRAGLFITSTVSRMITALKISWLFLVPSTITDMMTRRDVFETLKPRMQPCGQS